MINLAIQNQHNNETSGLTCLHAIYEHFNNPVPLNDIIHRVERSVSGRTLPPFLAGLSVTYFYRCARERFTPEA